MFHPEKSAFSRMSKLFQQKPVYRIFFTCAFVAQIVVLVWYHTSEKSPPSLRSPCWALNGNCDNKTSIHVLRETPVSQNSIYFIEAHGHLFLNPRILCGVESASRAYPNKTVYLLSTQTSVYRTKAVEALLRRPNVVITHLNPGKLFEKSPIKDWYRKKTWKQSMFPMYDFGDALRWLVIWSYGGIYLDSDVIVLRRFPEHRKVGCWEHTHIGAGALKFPPRDPIIQGICEAINVMPPSTVWGLMAPKILTKVVQELCLNNSALAKASGCDELIILPKKAVYPLHYNEWTKYFEEDLYLSLSMVTDPEIYAVHVWNKLSKDKPLLTDSNGPYAVMSRLFCPLVVKSVGGVM